MVGTGWGPGSHWFWKKSSKTKIKSYIEAGVKNNINILELPQKSNAVYLKAGLLLQDLGQNDRLKNRLPRWLSGKEYTC